MYDIMESMIKAVRKPGTGYEIDDIQIKQKGNFCTVNLTSKVTKKKKHPKKEMKKKIAEVARGMLVDEEDLWAWSVPET
jgi:electron transfer flavoprotein alpha/beta subunit